jgi:hypothetical protein
MGPARCAGPFSFAWLVCMPPDQPRRASWYAGLILVGPEAFLREGGGGLRGPQHDALWARRACPWCKPNEAWDMGDVWPTHRRSPAGLRHAAADPVVARGDPRAAHGSDHRHDLWQPRLFGGVVLRPDHPQVRRHATRATGTVRQADTEGQPRNIPGNETVW